MLGRRAATPCEVVESRGGRYDASTASVLKVSYSALVTRSTCSRTTPCLFGRTENWRTGDKSSFTGNEVPIIYSNKAR
jgi:hypothetical protein